MRKTLALLLAAAFLYFVPSHPRSIKSQTLVASSKFHTVANPIPNRYIVVLATTDLSPIAAPAPTPKAATPQERSGFSCLGDVSDSNSMSFVAEPMPDDPVVLRQPRT